MLSKEELDLLLLYNAYLYKTAAEGILKGQFAINPYSENGRNIAPFVEQFKSITGFEADRHLGQARFLTKLDQKGIRGEKVKAAWIEDEGGLEQMIKQAFLTREEIKALRSRGSFYQRAKADARTDRCHL